MNHAHTIEADKARAERAAADPAAYAAEKKIPISKVLSGDPEARAAFAAAHPEELARYEAAMRKLATGLIFDAPLDRIADEDGAHDILRRVRSERQRRGQGSALRLFDSLARRRRVVPASQGRREPRAAGVRTRGSRRCSSSSTTSGSDPGDPEPEPERVCLCGCGRSIAHKAPQAKFFDSEACRKRLDRAEAKLIPAAPSPLRRSTPVAEVDPDPDSELQALMEGYYDGQYLHPIRELAPEWAKRRRLSGEWPSSANAVAVVA